MFTKVFYKNISALQKNKAVIINYGGSSSSKTITVMQVLKIIAEVKPNQYILLIANSVPKLKTTLIKDFQNIIMKDDFNFKLFNKQDNTYTFPNGSVFKFANAYDENTYKGVRCDYAMLDECNTYKNGQGVFDQIEIRCSYTVFLTFNPSSKFWVTDVMSREDAETIHSTYKDNQYIENAIVKKLEMRAGTDENFYKVYVLGEWGALEGLVFKFKSNWDYYTEEPKEYDSEYWGLDFGFAVSKNALVRVRTDASNKIAYCKQMHVSKELTNPELAKRLKLIVPDKYIICDGARPDTIVDLRNNHKLNTIGVKKPPGSVIEGTQLMKGWMLLLEENSSEMIDDFFNYKHAEIKDDSNIEKNPIKKHDDFIDAIRYIFLKYRL